MNMRARRLLVWIGAMLMAVGLMVSGMVYLSKTVNADSSGSCSDSSGTIGTASWKIDGSDCSLDIGPGELPANPLDNSRIPLLWGIGDHNHIKTVRFTNPEATTLPEDSSYLFAGFNGSFQGLEGLDTHNVKNMSNMFYRYSGPDFQYDLSNWDTSKVNDMSSMFSFANVKYDQNVVKLNTSSVSNLSAMFEGFNGELYNIPMMDTSNATDMSHMFSMIDLKNALDLSGLKTGKVWNMSSMFSSTKGSVVGINGFDTSSLNTTSSMFSNSDLRNPDGTSIDLDLSGWDVRNLVEDDKMFTSGTYGSINMSGWQLESIQDGGVLNADIYNSITTINGDLNVSGWKIGGSANALNNFMFLVKVGNIKGIDSWKFTTHKKYVSISKTYLTRSDSIIMSNLDLTQLEGIILNDVTVYNGVLSRLDLSGSRGSNGFYTYVNTRAKVIDLSGLNDPRSDSLVIPQPGLEEITIPNGMHLYNAPNPPDLGGKYTGRWARKTGPGEKSMGWVSGNEHAGQDLEAFSKEANAGGTYVMQEKMSLSFDKNTSDQVTGSVPDKINDEWPNMNGGVSVPDIDLNTESKEAKSWNDKSDGTGDAYRPGEYVNKPGDTVLYAVWNDKPKNKVIFDMNDDSGKTDTLTTADYSIVINCDAAPSRTGTTFIGWSRDKSGVLAGPKAGKEGKVEACGYSNAKKIKLNSGDNKLYAVWAKRPKLIIDENRPTDMKGVLPSKPTIDSDWWVPGANSKTTVGATIPGWFVGYSPDGVYRFDGWRNADGSKFDGTVLEHDDVTIKAEWSKVKQAENVTPNPPATLPADPGQTPTTDPTPSSPSNDAGSPNSTSVTGGSSNDASIGQGTPDADQPNADDRDVVSQEPQTGADDDRASDDNARSMASTGSPGVRAAVITSSVLLVLGLASALLARMKQKI